MKTIEFGKEWFIVRRYESTKHGLKPQPDEWSFVHRDYDGPEDGRCGFATTLEDIYQQIRELEDGARPEEIH